MKLDIDCLEAFVALARHEHYGRAAASLCLGTSALSKRVSRLEHDVGESLVIRGPGGVVGLTPDGERVLREASRLLAAADRIRGRRTPRIVRIGVPGGAHDHLPTASWQIIDAMLGRTVEGARLVVVGVPYGADDTWLLEDRIDVMLATVPPQARTLAERPVAECGRVLITALDHPLAEKGYAQVADAYAGPIVVAQLAPEAWMRPWHLGDIERVPAQALYSVSATCSASIIDVVAARRACGIIADVCAPMVRGRLAVLPLVDAPAVLARAVYRAGDSRAEITGLIDVLRLLAGLAPPGVESSSEAPEPKRHVARPETSCGSVGVEASAGFAAQ